MELEKVKNIANELGLDVGDDLRLYKNGKEVGKIYRVENTDQYALTANFQEQTEVNGLLGVKKSPQPENKNLEKMLESGDTIKLGKNCRHAPGELAIVDEVKKWGVTCYVNDPTDKGKRLPLRIEYGFFELVSRGKTIH